ncbi:hypothetical protein EZS27_015539 [termite gut metagenome]|uniref:Alginate export domain-containing protein n=1 Tax=termite gut metagenome TaxID=433724 RepID=A0A5J4RQT3_9ZZZZ
MKKNLLLLLTALVSSGFVSFAQAQGVSIDAEVRSRAEYRDGFQKPLATGKGVDGAYVNNLRTKLNLLYDYEGVKSKISLQDTRTYGSTTVKDTGGKLGVLEAWGEYNFTPAFSFVLGRQALEYDDKRLFSASNWSNAQQAHDLLLLKYVAGDFTAHFGSAWNNRTDDQTRIFYDVASSYKALNYLWLTKPVGPVAISVIWVNDLYETSKTTEDNKVKIDKKIHRNTVGANANLSDKNNPFSLYATAYYQFGYDNSTNDNLNNSLLQGKSSQGNSLSAYLVALKAQYKFSPQWSALAGADLYSGSKNDIEAGKSNTFNKLYGTNHAFNGSIEYWSTLPKQGLLDVFAGATGKFTPKFDINATFHFFTTAQEISVAPGAEKVGKGLGSELDLTANYTLSKQLAVQGGWSTYFTNKGTEALKNVSDTRFPQWAYIQLTFKPSFFSQKL